MILGFIRKRFIVAETPVPKSKPDSAQTQNVRAPLSTHSQEVANRENGIPDTEAHMKKQTGGNSGSNIRVDQTTNQNNPFGKSTANPFAKNTPPANSNPFTSSSSEARHTNPFKNEATEDASNISEHKAKNPFASTSDEDSRDHQNPFGRPETSNPFVDSSTVDDQQNQIDKSQESSNPFLSKMQEDNQENNDKDSNPFLKVESDQEAFSEPEDDQAEDMAYSNTEHNTDEGKISSTTLCMSSKQVFFIIRETIYMILSCAKLLMKRRLKMQSRQQFLRNLFVIVVGLLLCMFLLIFSA